jgi:hypothetical protein
MAPMMLAASLFQRNISLTYKIQIMDSKNNRGRQDKIRVDLNDPSEVEYLHSRYPNRSHQQVKDAIKAYGPFRKDIERQLEKLY